MICELDTVRGGKLVATEAVSAGICRIVFRKARMRTNEGRGQA
jgi:hypothetical protein